MRIKRCISSVLLCVLPIISFAQGDPPPPTPPPPPGLVVSIDANITWLAAAGIVFGICSIKWKK